MTKLKEKLKHFFNNNFVKCFITYTLLFLLLIIVLLSIFGKYNKDFIYYVDSIDQHFVFLRYFRDLLINFIRTGNFSFFTWNLGCGFDLFSNFSFMILGDAFSYLSILVRTKDVEFLYNFLIWEFVSSLFFRSHNFVSIVNDWN